MIFRVVMRRNDFVNFWDFATREQAEAQKELLEVVRQINCLEEFDHLGIEEIE